MRFVHNNKFSENGNSLPFCLFLCFLLAGEEANRLCLQFAVKQAKSSSSLTSFLSSWLSTGLFNGLQVSIPLYDSKYQRIGVAWSKLS